VVSELQRRVWHGRSRSSRRHQPFLERHDVRKGNGEGPSTRGNPELGGSNDIANLFPEKRDVSPGYKVKDKLENHLHDLVCDGKLTLSSVRRRIASNWQTLYESVFGVAPTG
jgi:hypothetical protein